MRRTPAEFLLKEFDLDLKLLDSWSDEQVLDLRTLHYYLRQTDHENKNLEMMGTAIQRRGKRQVSMTGRIDRGFGGAGGGKRGANTKRGGGGAKRKRKSVESWLGEKK